MEEGQRLNLSQRESSEESNNKHLAASMIEKIVARDSSAGSSSTRVRIQDVVNPMESEAEAAILRAAENQQGKDATNSADAIFPELTEDAVEHMQQTDDELGGDDAPDESQGNTSRMRSENHTLGTDSTATLPTFRARQGNVDGKLYSLAMMMKNIHMTGREAQGTAVATGDDKPKPAAALPEAATESDALANTAALLFREQILEDDNEETDNLIEASDTSGSSTSHEEQPLNEADVEMGVNPTNQAPRRRTKKKKNKGLYRKTMEAAKSDWASFCDFMKNRQKAVLKYIKRVILFLFLPTIAVSALLYYGVGNPLMDGGASISWFLIFLLIRQVITFTLARMTQAFVIDFLALKTRSVIRIIGPTPTLMVVQSKGWPFIMTWWGFYDLILLTGRGQFVNHWLFYQPLISLFNADNPSRGIPSHPMNYNVVVTAIVVGIVVGIKRVVVGLYLGQRQYSIYGAKLANVIHRMIVISQVGNLARRFEEEAVGETASTSRRQSRALANDIMNQWEHHEIAESKSYEEKKDDYASMAEQVKDSMLGRKRDVSQTNDEGSIAASVSSSPQIDVDNLHGSSGSLRPSERQLMSRTLEHWEEPEEESEKTSASIKAILQFKQTLAFMDLSFPFSTSFGPADTRERCFESSANTYKRLLLGNGALEEGASTVLKFEALSELVQTDDGTSIDETKLKDLLRVFRPDKDGTVDFVHFARGVDKVYKDLKLLRASIQNSSQIDRALEKIINFGFYFVVGCIVLAAWKVDPLAFFLSISSFVVAFSFMIGSSAASYFTGLLFIFARSPYDIGDRISINKADQTPTMDGEATWFVEKMTLFYTTLRLGATNEVATIANSSLAACRVINAARSPKALVYVNMKFGIDVPYSRIQLFTETVMSFVKDRPREWLSCAGIRATRVEADMGYVQYIVILQHRESWQNIGAVLQSKAEVMSFCLEVQKQLGMRYIAPSTPIDLEFRNSTTNVNMIEAAASAVRGGSMNEKTLEEEVSSAAHHRSQSTGLGEVVSMFARKD